MIPFVGCTSDPEVVCKCSAGFLHGRMAAGRWGCWERPVAVPKHDYKLSWHAKKNRFEIRCLCGDLGRAGVVREAFGSVNMFYVLIG